MLCRYKLKIITELHYTCINQVVELDEYYKTVLIFSYMTKSQRTCKITYENLQGTNRISNVLSKSHKVLTGIQDLIGVIKILHG